jgi:hypothetical protein
MWTGVSPCRSDRKASMTGSCIFDAGPTSMMPWLPVIRGLHSSTSQLSVSTFCGIRWVPSVHMTKVHETTQTLSSK